MTSIATAIREADAGMARAADHAERVVPAWSSTAYSFLLCFATMRAQFTSEDCSEWAAGMGLEQPSPRAWGSIYRRAAQAGIIVKAGYGVSKRRHLSPCPVWASRVYTGETA